MSQEYETPLLRVQGLSVDFRDANGRFIPAVKNVSFNVNAGRTLGIVGESGSGKSVTSMAIMQLLDARAAHIPAGKTLLSLPGRPAPIDTLQLAEREMRHLRGRHISMIFQEPMSSLNPVMTVGKQVMEPLMVHLGLTAAGARQRAIELFEKVRLPSPALLANRYPHQLSGGQKQRVMIAMAIACNPEVLIADEPTTALDVTVQRNILELLNELREEQGMGMIFITHDLGVIAEIAHDIAVMYRGEIVEYGPAAQILRAPEHPYTRALMACRPPRDRYVSRLPTVADFMPTAENNTKESEKTVAEVWSALTIPKPPEKPRGKEILSVQNVSVEFPGPKTGLFSRSEAFKAVKNVSFSVSVGETLGLVGESGCGKTTLGRSILQLVPTSAGQILFAGMNLNELPPAALRAARKRIQLIFQDPFASLNPRLTIGETIMEPMRVHGLHGNRAGRKKATLELLDKVGLSESAMRRFPHQFSGGQRQRIVIARALAVQPDFIVCDESVSALDVSVQAQVLNLLNELKRELGLTYIFISHDLEVVKYFSDNIAVMKAGEIVEYGTADAVYHRPQTEYTRELLEAAPNFEPIIA